MAVNYRKIYCEHLHMDEIPDGMVIHHIDGNRKNNQIFNLVMIPAKLHVKYHALLNECKNLFGTLGVPDGKLEYSANNPYETYRRFCEVYSECIVWVKHRDDILQLIDLDIDSLNGGIA